MVMQSGLTEAGTARPWPAERIEYWAIERLIPYASNARLHSEGDIDKLADSLRRWGWTNRAGDYSSPTLMVQTPPLRLRNLCTSHRRAIAI